MIEIFVFGSNLAGRHGKGAALYAFKNHGALYGSGWGLQGQSYAIPTKDRSLRSLPLSYIQLFVDDFLDFAKNNFSDYVFNVTPIGCGLAGYKPHQIAPMFDKHGSNIRLPVEFIKARNG